jgi:hypothetical protein
MNTTVRLADTADRDRVVELVLAFRLERAPQGAGDVASA